MKSLVMIRDAIHDAQRSFPSHIGDAARWHLAPIQFVDTVRPRRASHRAVDAPLVEEETPGLVVRALRRALRRVRDSGDRQRDAKRGDGVRRSNGKTAEGPLFRKLSHTSVFFAISNHEIYPVWALCFPCRNDSSAGRSPRCSNVLSESPPKFSSFSKPLCIHLSRGGPQLFE